MTSVLRSCSLEVSIIICTLNRCESLRETIDAIGHLRLGGVAGAELIIVDNGSTDRTEQVVNETTNSNMPIRYFVEPERGQCRARNKGLAEAQGEIIVFTDDDVRPEADWLEALCEPIRVGIADATVGTIRMAPHLRRPWMCVDHYLCLACNEGIGLDHPSPDLVGANMAFTRRAVEAVGGFDNELGPGRGTGGDDTLLSWKMKAAGLRIVRLAAAVVEHHFDPTRLTRKSFVQTAIRSGWNDAYLAHHWLHETPRNLRLAIARAWLRLWYYRLRRWREWIGVHEGISVWEKGMIQELATLRELRGIVSNEPVYKRPSTAIDKPYGHRSSEAII